MSKQPETFTEAADMLIDWNERAAAFIKKCRDYWDENEDPDWVEISFDRRELDLFMRNQESAKEGLRLLRAFVAEKEAAE
ncbi:hypothetical protein [Antarcticirhabdus aurantiaca]|uniref:Uncharacterized protein n=1 Tax=Antarcticirhabdus aurantiaca TaxID=2606717 RepID=A0ACD4NW06_9HYPH|nr:hypothetical protein [Antarcticirhabdus aurantiaca]WAJ31171.1 hypothetical protein OXU80_13610 [Jeongeuplla avenae]